jgi:opacity protein-like surface antigen
MIFIKHIGKINNLAQILKILLMKKNLLLGLMLLVATGLSAQMYVGLGLGYHGAANNQALGTSTNSNGDKSNVYGTMGNGFLVDLKFGYMFDEHWGFELGINSLFGAKNLINEDLNLPTGFTSYEDKTYAQSNMFRLTPQFVFKTDMGIYTRVGVIIPVGGKTMIYEDISYTVAGTSGTTSVEAESHGNFTFGFTGAFGYGFDLSDNMMLFGELQYIGLRIYGKTRTLTKYEQNGKDQLGNMKTIQKETEFVDEVLKNDNQDMDKPYKDLKTASPYSSFGLNIGLVFKFN